MSILSFFRRKPKPTYFDFLKVQLQAQSDEYDHVLEENKRALQIRDETEKLLWKEWREKLQAVAVAMGEWLDEQSPDRWQRGQPCYWKLPVWEMPKSRATIIHGNYRMDFRVEVPEFDPQFRIPSLRELQKMRQAELAVAQTLVHKP